MAFSFSDVITREYILSRLSEEQLFERYLGAYPRLGERFVNTLPGRPKLDTTPGCWFFEKSDNRLVFIDKAWKNFDCFAAAQQYYNCGWQQTLQNIAKDFGLLDGNSNHVLTADYSIQEPRRTKHREGYVPIQVRVKPWKEKDVAFWQFKDQEITTDQLEKERVYPISHFWFDSYLSGSDLGACSYGFLMGYPDKWQIYRPLVKNKRYKFRQSSSSWIIGCSDLVKGKPVIFTKSNADRVCLKLLGYNVANVLSETVWPDQQQVELLESFGPVTMIWDNDQAGQTAVKERSDTYGWNYIEYPKSLGKDSKEICKAHGGQVVKDYLDELLSHGY